ncbi:N-acetylgalactosamine-N,N'-diacetylbacillosaminyl-diphospho-undecaprenol 4-alpha-N-acetylgalactosaminyltransferase [soil metagenome]
MQKKKISILIISLYSGGAERVVSILLNYFKDKFDIHLVLLQPIIEYEIPVGQQITILDKRPPGSPLQNILRIPLLAFRYHRFLKKNNINTSLSFLNRPNFIAGFLKILGWKGKVILSERTLTSEYYTVKTVGDRIGRFLVKNLYSKANLIVCNSKNIEADLRNTFNVQTNFRIIYNPIALDKIEVNTKHIAPLVNNNPFTFITIGRLSSIKNHLMLIKAIAILKDTNCRVQIIGKGELKEYLEKYIASIGMQERIALIDHTTNPFNYLTMADCFVLTSNFEGFPNVVLEALACNLPVISTDCKGGIRELLTPSISLDTPTTTGIMYGEYGLLVPVGNEQILAQAMTKIYSDSALRQIYRLKNYNRAKNFDVSTIMKSFDEILNQD